MGNRRYVVRRDDFKGAYSAATLYPTGSIVRSSGSSWRSLRAVQGVTPVEGADWTLFVSKGDPGVAGPPPWVDRGAYVAATAYAAGDAVRYGGSYWRALRAVTGVAPVEGADWTALVQKGDKGDRGVTPRGAYAAATTYAADDLVQYGGTQWRALRPVQSVTPVEGTDWTLFVSKGEIGATGPPPWADRGAYAAATAYAIGDAVQYGGSYWKALRANTGVTPVEGADWTRIVSKGDKGDQGIRGVTPRGAYSAATAYVADELVQYGGSSWRALRAVTGVTPVEGADWTLFVSKGDPGAAGNPATDTVAGVVELATASEIQAGAMGVLVATAADLKAELDRRAGLKSQIVGIDAGPSIWSNVTLTINVDTFSADLRTLAGVPPNAKGVFVTMYAGTQSSTSQVYIGSGDSGPSPSQRMASGAWGLSSFMAMVPLGTTNANAGKIAVRAVNSNCTGFFAWVNGYWT